MGETAKAYKYPGSEKYHMKFQWEYLPEEECWCARNIVYCDAPVNPDLQAMNIYVPACYMNPDGTIKADGCCSPRPGVTYTTATVPVIFYNDIGGYSECTPAGLIDRNHEFVEEGFVMVSVGARGRQSMDSEGKPSGKAPIAVVDLKAAVRFLRANKDELPGDLDKLVSVGTSAGGAMSSLLGATGNSEYFIPYLEKIQAAMDQPDDIFAAQCYCPITDLDHADMAYEWMFGSKSISIRGSKVLPVVMDGYHRELSGKLADAYVDYINSLPINATLGEDKRSGTFYTGLMEKLSESVTKFLHRNEEFADDLVGEINAGTDLIAWDGTNAVISDLDKYVRVFIGRMKECPAFDELVCKSYENQEFGDENELFRHFSADTAKIAGGEWTIPQEQYDRARHFNPLYYILAEERNTDIAPHYRIRLGSKDADTAFAISYTLYLALKSIGIDADYALVWGLGHCNADYPGEFAAWVDSLMEHKD